MLSASVELRVRNYDPTTDRLPIELLSGFGAMLQSLDPDWIWVLESDYGICAACIAASTHGALFLLRIAATDEAPPMWPRLLLKAVIEDAKERGVKGLWTILDMTRKEERRLARILERAGGILESKAMYLGAMKFD